MRGRVFGAGGGDEVPRLLFRLSRRTFARTTIIIIYTKTAWRSSERVCHIRFTRIILVRRAFAYMIILLYRIIMQAIETQFRTTKTNQRIYSSKIFGVLNITPTRNHHPIIVIKDNNIILPSPEEIRIKIRRDAIYAVTRARPVRGEHRRRDKIIYAAVTTVCAYRVALRDNSGGGALPGERTEVRVRGLDVPGPPRCISRISRHFSTNREL